MIKNHINILIQDSNRYFSQGLTALLHAECQRRHICVTFLMPRYRHRADIVIFTNNGYSLIRANSSPDGQARQSLLLIENHINYQTASRVQPNIGVIKRRDSISTVQALIELTLARHHEAPVKKALPGRQKLTARENEILSAIAHGLTSNQIARRYGLNIKTVSSHKCAAMRKLGLSRIHDLYHWLRCNPILEQTFEVGGRATSPHLMDTLMKINLMSEI
ncbi:helix-turn-helix transcriptional regulator [Serratia sp. S4]|uniref:helix-turn-helix domain-containing protein n=1 Tax=Serratia sp. S4 TaxID=768491 RepID=UPI000376727D|nr:helix-turn-helix transcriptional regulator [Serratia sp. S4]